MAPALQCFRKRIDFFHYCVWPFREEKRRKHTPVTRRTIDYREIQLPLLTFFKHDHTSHYDNRDFANPGAPFSGSRFVDRSAIGINRNRHRHVLDFKFVDCLHAQISECHHA